MVDFHIGEFSELWFILWPSSFRSSAFSTRRDYFGTRHAPKFRDDYNRYFASFPKLPKLPSKQGS